MIRTIHTLRHFQTIPCFHGKRVQLLGWNVSVCRRDRLISACRAGRNWELGIGNWELGIGSGDSYMWLTKDCEEKERVGKMKEPERWSRNGNSEMISCKQSQRVIIYESTWNWRSDQVNDSLSACEVTSHREILQEKGTRSECLNVHRMNEEECKVLQDLAESTCRGERIILKNTRRRHMAADKWEVSLNTRTPKKNGLWIE